MELTAAEAWSRILERARPLLPEHTFRIWLEHTEPMALSHDQLAVAAGSDFAAEWIGDKYGELLSEVAERVIGRTIVLTFQPQTGEGGPRQRGGRAEAAGGGARREPPSSVAPGGAPNAHAGSGGAPNPQAAHGGAASGQGSAGGAPGAPGSPSLPGSPVTAPALSTAPPGGVVFGSPLNERYSFDRFVVGANNQLSAAACRAVAEAPARMYNPLFIYGGVGLGKTHLMHAIGHTLLVRDGARRVAYVSSERFMNDLISSIQEGRMADFRRRYRDIDLLLIDDVQFLGERERTQEEFFHTFNALHEARRQIVMTSDRPPKDIAGLEERLVSRFEWGLVTDIKPPDLETRVAILRKKAEDDDISLDDEVLDYIARNCRSNVRELEGAVIKLLALSSLTRREVGLDLAKEALGGVLRVLPVVEVTPDLIRTRVAEEWGVSVDGLMSKRRTKDLTVPRQVAMYLIREMLDLSLVEIGNLFGGRDHSTVIHAINRVEEELSTDDGFRARVELLRAGFNG